MVIRQGYVKNERKYRERHAARESLTEVIKQMIDKCIPSQRDSEMYYTWDAFFLSLFKARRTLIYSRCLVTYKNRKHSPLEEH